MAVPQGVEVDDRAPAFRGGEDAATRMDIGPTADVEAVLGGRGRRPGKPRRQRQGERDRDHGAHWDPLSPV